MKKILKLIPILFIALMMISCSDEAQPSFDNVIDPSIELEKDVKEIPPESGLYEGNGNTTYEKAKSEDPYSEGTYIPWDLTVGKDQIKLSVDKKSLGEYLSQVPGAPLFPRGIDLPDVLEINLLNSGSIQNFLDFYCRTYTKYGNNPDAVLPRETKTVTINTVTGLDAIKDDPEMSIESVTWIFSTSTFKVLEISGECEYTTANNDGRTISTITLKEVPITANYLDIEVVAKKGDKSTVYEAPIEDIYHPTNKDGKVNADATGVTAEFSPKTYEDTDPSEFDWNSLEFSAKMQLVSLNGEYVTDQTSPYYKISIGLLMEEKYTKDDEIMTNPEDGTPYYRKEEGLMTLTLRKDTTSGNLILSEMYDNDDNGTYDEEREIGEYTKRK